MENWINCFEVNSVMLLGDMNFDCSTLNVGFQIFKPFV